MPQLAAGVAPGPLIPSTSTFVDMSKPAIVCLWVIGVVAAALIALVVWVLNAPLGVYS